MFLGIRVSLLYVAAGLAFAGGWTTPSAAASVPRSATRPVQTPSLLPRPGRATAPEDRGGGTAPRAASTAETTATGTANTTTADPPVAHPNTPRCEVPLFSGVSFSNFSPKPFQFAPPAACRGPWAKVVLVADFSVSAGRQFDRTATIGLGGATIYFGTTAEPSRTVAPSWHVERDLTDLSALFRTPRMGQVSIGNIVDATYTGVLHGRAALEFYTATRRFPAPVVADLVVPLADSNGNPVALQTGADSLAQTFSAPPTIERAYLDVIAQSQIGDEFWYTCFPNDLAARLNNCGNTAFRETEVTLDHRPAGVAPIYPWIYTGGIDPFLWRPIPGVQTLNFVPYRVDLTPFAATLDDAAAHTVALSVFNANHYFSATANLLLFLDHGAKRALTGALDASSLGAVAPETVAEGGSFDANGLGTGTIDTNSQREFAISGHVDTSHGRVRTDLRQSIAFTQHQAVTNSATSFVQDIAQNETIVSDVLRTGASFSDRTRTRFLWPFALNYSFAVRPDGTFVQATSVSQGYDERTNGGRPGPEVTSALSDVVTSADTLFFDASFNVTGHTNDASAQTYALRTSDGTCYGRTVTSANGFVTENVARPCDVDR